MSNIIRSLVILCISSSIINSCLATRYASGNEIAVIEKTGTYVAYVVIDDDILTKRVCECIPRNRCWKRDNIKLTGDQCNFPNICCVISASAAGVDLEKYF